MKTEDIKDTEDGITHINIYSKGKTELGKMLSNFYKFPIKTADGDFMSVEGYWYWLSIDDSVEEKEELRKLYGFAAKKRGKEILAETNNGENSRFEPDFERKILTAIWYKFRRCSDMLLPEYYNLPIVHYYCYGGKVVDVTDKYKWMIEGITKLRNHLVSQKSNMFTCRRCGSTMYPVMFTELEINKKHSYTGRKRLNASHLECPNCLLKEAVDSQTFAKEWYR